MLSGAFPEVSQTATISASLSAPASVQELAVLHALVFRRAQYTLGPVLYKPCNFQTLFPVCGSSSHSPDSIINKTRAFHFDSFMDYAFGGVSQNSVLNPRSQRLSSASASKNVMA